MNGKDLLAAYGRTMTVLQWSSLEGAPTLRTLLRRLRSGVDPERALVEKNLPEDRGRNSKRHSRYRGVTLHKGGWLAQIKVEGRVKQIGPFETDEEAAREFDKLARKHGRRQNFRGDGA